MRMEQFEDRLLLTIAADVADSFQSGFNTVDQFHVANLVARVDLPPGSVPFVTSRLAEQLNLSAALGNAVQPVALSTIGNMNELRNELVAAGVIC